MRLRVGRALLLCIGLLVPLVGAPDAARAERLLDLIPFGRAHRLSRVLPAVVNISMTKMKTDAPTPGQTTPPEPHLTQFYGSGFIVDASGIIVTNRHVVDGALQVAVTLQNGSTLPARIIGTATIIDIALLKVDFDKPLPTVRWADSDKVRVGDQVFAIGNPLGVGQTVTSGIVSALNRDILISPYDDFIQTDAAINHGNSGGPLFDSRGEVIGVNTAIFSPTETGGSIGIGFAIPARDVQFAIDRLRRFGQLRPGWIGLRTQDVTSEIAEAIGLAPARGVIVAGTEPKSPAAASGLAEGDVVLRFDGQVPKDNRALARMIAEAPTGQPASLTVWRDGRERSVSVTVQEWPQEPAAATKTAAVPAVAPAGSTDPVALGLRLGPISKEARIKYKLAAEVSGVLVEEVTPNSVSAGRGLAAGDVILKIRDAPVATADQLAKGLAAAGALGHRNALLLVQKNDGQHWVTVPLGTGR
ncbi:MAG TPA: trypsin-like peptidase domain-containing protein [Acetobacteraceae bacterium]|nr:trypsin-like peptidase domain-containing protein [Acetobacteraceae bacterium]